MAVEQRRWGWHPLDPRWAERLVADAALPRRALVVDVGAGLGAVTAPLVNAGARVIAVELHPERAARLRERFALDDVVVVQADGADLRLPRRGFFVVASPPYSATTALLRRILHPGSRLLAARLVVQDQAARRWAGVAAPGRRRWDHTFSVEAGPRVPRAAFDPRPCVDSRILVIRRRDA